MILQLWNQVLFVSQDFSTLLKLLLISSYWSSGNCENLIIPSLNINLTNPTLPIWFSWWSTLGAIVLQVPNRLKEEHHVWQLTVWPRVHQTSECIQGIHHESILQHHAAVLHKTSKFNIKQQFLVSICLYVIKRMSMFMHVDINRDCHRHPNKCTAQWQHNLKLWFSATETLVDIILCRSWYKFDGQKKICHRILAEF